VTTTWAASGTSPRGGPGPDVTIVDGSTFCISGVNGDILTTVEGLFLRDRRVLSRWLLEVEGSDLEPLTVVTGDPFRATFLTRAQPGSGQADSTLLLVRERQVGDGMWESIRVRNLGRETAGVSLTLHVAVDFADLFAVKASRAVGPPAELVARDGGLEATTDVGGQLWRLRVVPTRSSPTWHGHRPVAGGPSAGPGRLSWEIAVPPRVEWHCEVLVELSIDGQPLLVGDRTEELRTEAAAVRRAQEWRANAPVVTSHDSQLVRTLGRSLEDLGALRIFDPQHPERVAVAAGAPWFMALFGRDSLLSSWMVLPVDSRLAVGTLHALADAQGRQVNPLTEEEPGRILHEVRRGRPGTMDGSYVSYGTVDATPLFVMLLGELRRWGLATAEVDALVPAADRALDWIVEYGDRDGDGFVEYERATDRGLLHQGWKDSFDAISFADGRFAEPPIALCEVQGYAYSAYLSRAHLARERQDDEAAERWAQRAANLKHAFNERFWLPDRGWYALGLDRDKRPIDALASNMGHCLWTGIVDEDKAHEVAARLLSADMFTGWGIRTLARSMVRYNPVSYHNGSVWPHDSAIVAAGLARYGFVEEAQAVATGLLDAAAHFHGRLPELFCGFDREEFPTPVQYPTACTPQAWASAAPFLLLRSLLRFDPWVPQGEVRLAPVLPDRYLPLRLSNVGLAGRRVTVEVTDLGFDIEGLGDVVHVYDEPRSPLTSLLPHRPE
jgi:glycogen debranching enzyme